MSMPFLDLANNVGGFKIKAKSYELDLYRKHLKNMLLNMNTYFVKNGLYVANEYEMLTNLLINSYAYTFEVHKNLPDKIRGRFAKALGISTGSVLLNEKYFYNEEETEGYLCHEFIHLITTGLDYITYKTENGKVEIVVPDNNRLKAGYKKTYVDGKCVSTEILKYSDLGENNFLKEGLTEKLKQQIYPHYLSPKSYPVETNFVDILNFISGFELKDCFMEFLRGDLVTYKKVLTKDVFEHIQKELKLHFDNDNTKHNHTESVHYKNALELTIKAGCRHFDKTRPTVESFIKFVDDLSSMLLVCDKEMLYNSTIDYAVKVFNNSVTKNKHKTEAFKLKYKKYIEDKSMELWYKNTKNAEKGFKLWGLSEDIYFLPNYSCKEPASVWIYEMNLTPCLMPSVVGHSTVFGNGTNEQKIIIKRESENSVSYTQGDMKRIVKFEGVSVIVVDENEKVVDLGYLSSFQNEKFKHHIAEETKLKLIEFKQQCILEKNSTVTTESNGFIESQEENVASENVEDIIYDDFVGE